MAAIKVHVKWWKDDICVCVNFLMGREGRNQSDGHLSAERCGVQELREQNHRSSISQRIEVSTGSGVCTEGEKPCLKIDFRGKA